MRYTYTESDLLKNPIRYQMSPFNGKDFLTSFLNSRNSIIKNISTNISLYDFLSQQENEQKIQKIIVDFEKFNFNTTELLIYILKNQKIFYHNLVGRLIKKFELKRIIPDELQKNFIEGNTTEKILLNYCLFSIICLKYFEETENLKYLNTSLKINDIICSAFTSLDKNYYPLVKYCLELEINSIINLCNKNGIEI